MAKAQKKAFEASREFTDRIEPRRAFKEEYEIAKKAADEYFILSYYGIGGIGKSTLMDKLVKENFLNLDPKENIGNHYIKYDFEVSTEVRSILTSLRNMLMKLDSKKFQFLRFDLACLKYADMVGINSNLAETQKDVIGNNPILSAALEVGGAIPVISSFAQIITAVNESKNAIVSVSHQMAANRVYAELNGLVDNEILKKLPEFFSEDLNECTEKLDEPLVIFLDTYEKLVNYLETDFRLHDEWLVDPSKGIIPQSNHILWVIAGRDKLQLDWEAMGFESIGNKTLDQVDNPDDYVESKLHLLGNLSDVDAGSFLKKAGIPEMYYEDIIRITQGNPLWLDVAVGLYENSINRGTEFELSGLRSADKMVERYIRYMDNDMQDLVKRLAILGKWDNASISIIGHVNYTVYDKAKRSCIINEGDDAFFYMHNLMRETICDMCKAEHYEPIHHIYEAVYAYYSDLLNKTDAKDIKYAEYLSFLIDFYLFHEDTGFDLKAILLMVQKIELAGAYQQYLKITEKLWSYLGEVGSDLAKANVQNAYFAALLNMGFFKKGRPIIEPAYEALKAAIGEDAPETMQCARILSTMLWETGARKEGLALSDSLYEKQRAILGEDALQTLTFGQELANKHWYNGDREIAMGMDKEIYEKRCRLLGENHIDTLKSATACAADTWQNGDREKGFEMTKVVYERKKNVLGEEHPETLKSASNLSICMWDLNMREESLALKQEVYDIRKRTLGENHPSTLLSLKIVGVALWNMGKRKEAIEIDQEVYDRRKQTLGEDHPDTLTSASVLAVDLWEMGRKEEAVEFDRVICEKRKAILGENHPDTLKSISTYGTDLWNMGQKDEALAMHKWVYEKRREILGECHQNTLHSATVYASELWNMGKKEESTQMDLDIWEKQIKYLGENHPDTLTSMTNCAVDLWEIGKKDEATALDLDVLTRRKKVLGENHPDTLKSMQSYAIDLWNLGKMEESHSILQEVFEKRKVVLGEEHEDTIKVRNILKNFD